MKVMTKSLCIALLCIVVGLLAACGDPTATIAPVASTGTATSGDAVGTAVAATIAAQAGSPAPSADGTTIVTAPPTVVNGLATVTPAPATSVQQPAGSNSAPTATQAAPAPTAPAAASATSAPKPTAAPTKQAARQMPAITQNVKIYASNKVGQPFAVVYPDNWQVLQETAANSKFADLKNLTVIAYPGDYNYGIRVYSGAANAKDNLTILKNFLAYENTVFSIKVTVQPKDLTDTTAVAEFTAADESGDITAAVWLENVAGEVYLRYNFYDTAFFNKASGPEVENAANVYPIRPLTDKPQDVSLDPRRLIGGGTASVACAKGWTYSIARDANVAGCTWPGNPGAVATPVNFVVGASTDDILAQASKLAQAASNGERYVTAQVKIADPTADAAYVYVANGFGLNQTGRCRMIYVRIIKDANGKPLGAIATLPQFGLNDEMLAVLQSVTAQTKL